MRLWLCFSYSTTVSSLNLFFYCKCGVSFSTKNNAYELFCIQYASPLQCLTDDHWTKYRQENCIFFPYVGKENNFFFLRLCPEVEILLLIILKTYSALIEDNGNQRKNVYFLYTGQKKKQTKKTKKKISVSCLKLFSCWIFLNSAAFVIYI